MSSISEIVTFPEPQKNYINITELTLIISPDCYYSNSFEKFIVL